jgi:hypothetical protein
LVCDGQVWQVRRKKRRQERRKTKKMQRASFLPEALSAVLLQMNGVGGKQHCPAALAREGWAMLGIGKAGREGRRTSGLEDGRILLLQAHARSGLPLLVRVVEGAAPGRAGGRGSDSARRFLERKLLALLRRQCVFQDIVVGAAFVPLCDLVDLTQRIHHFRTTEEKESLKLATMAHLGNYEIISLIL